MTNTAAIVAAIKLRKERNIVALLREHNALSPASAIQIDQQSGLANAALRGLVSHGAVLQSQPDRYWLDEVAYKTMRQMRTITMSVLIVLAVGVVGAAIWLSLQASS